MLFRSLAASPYTDAVTLEAAAALRDEFGLGDGPQVDVLTVSLSATDFIGHRYGTRGPEMCDQLARLDDRQLADIGLTRSDLRDAYAEPLWEDPTSVLARRAAERRMSRKPAGKPSRKRAAFENSIEQEEGKLPSANRPACYLA